MLGGLLLPEIEELIADRKFTVLRQWLADLTVIEMADLFGDLPPTTLAIIFRILPRDKASRVFEYLSLEMQEVMLRAMGHEEVAAVLNDMSPDDRTNLLEELPAEAVQRLLGLLSSEERKVAQSLLGYPPESIGRLMTPDYVVVHQDWTVGNVFDHLRKVGREKESFNILYVIDKEGHLIDDLTLRELILADPLKQVSEVMDGHYVSLKAKDDQEVAIGVFKKYDRTNLPVIDIDGKLVGIVTVDDVLDVVEEEETEDVHKMAAVETLDAPYLDVNFFTMARKRGVWLSVLFLGEMLTASAMGYFETEISKAVVLALFIPLIISSGGNSGSQASTLVIRAMALGEVKLRDWWKIFRRELGCGLLLGVFLGLIGLARVHLWQYLGWMDYTSHYHLVGLSVACALVGVVMWGTLTGSMLPFILRLLKLDPAAISAPFVATLVDVCGLVIYFMIALVILHGTLL